MEDVRHDLMGEATAREGRFPLLVKILDAEEMLSLQVHPPATVAKQLGGEPKTEMWYVVDTVPGAQLFVGLRRGVTRAEFELRIGDGSVAECFHRVLVHPGDVMNLPSGRVHALGSGNVIFEIQENSDTTYRIHDWNRMGPDQRRRELHIQEALASMDFADFEPKLIPAGPADDSLPAGRMLVDHPAFQAYERSFTPGTTTERTAGRPIVLGLIEGHLGIEGGGILVTLKPGEFCLIPACTSDFKLNCLAPAKLLWTTPG
jgi:mannose-6-phosphate isomerase